MSDSRLISPRQRQSVSPAPKYSFLQTMGQIHVRCSVLCRKGKERQEEKTDVCDCIVVTTEVKTECVWLSLLVCSVCQK